MHQGFHKCLHTLLQQFPTELFIQRKLAAGNICMWRNTSHVIKKVTVRDWAKHSSQNNCWAAIQHLVRSSLALGKSINLNFSFFLSRMGLQVQHSTGIWLTLCFEWLVAILFYSPTAVVHYWPKCTAVWMFTFYMTFPFINQRLRTNCVYKW